MTLVDERPVAAEHDNNMGFVEGPNNRNPWSREMGIGDTSYCDCGASLVPHHHGVQWWDWCQFGARGSAYCPYHITAALKAGHWRGGRACELEPMALVFYSWNGDSIADHVETVKATYADGTFDTWAYNAGRPEGAHVIHRDRKYVLGCIPMRGVFYGDAPAPDPTPPPAQREYDMVRLYIAKNDTPDGAVTTGTVVACTLDLELIEKAPNPDWLDGAVYHWRDFGRLMDPPAGRDTSDFYEARGYKVEEVDAEFLRPIIIR